MKNFMPILIIVLSFVLSSCISTKKSIERDKEIEVLVTRMIESNQFVVLVNYLSPMRSGSRYVSGDYTLEVRKDSTFAYLPYFGYSRSTPMNDDIGVKFESRAENYTCRSNKRDSGWIIEFYVRSAKGRYDVRLEVYKNGSATININDDRRDPIVYNGRITQKTNQD